MKKMVEKLACMMELGGIKKDIVFLSVSGLALIVSIFDLLPVAIRCGMGCHLFFAAFRILTGAVIGLVTAFDVKSRCAGVPCSRCFGLYRGGFCGR